jgi:hypothetical protein
MALSLQNAPETTTVEDEIARGFSCAKEFRALLGDIPDVLSVT